MEEAADDYDHAKGDGDEEKEGFVDVDFGPSSHELKS